MATASMACDQMSINRINPFTWSGSYGLYSDGFPSTIKIDGSYLTEMSEEPTVYTDPLDEPTLSVSGNMYLKTVDASPAPYRMFPARKQEFQDGTVTWMRPGQPWSWMTGRAGDDTWTARGGSSDIVMWLVIIALVVYIMFRIKK